MNIRDWINESPAFVDLEELLEGADQVSPIEPNLYMLGYIIPDEYGKDGMRAVTVFAAKGDEGTDSEGEALIIAVYPLLSGKMAPGELMNLLFLSVHATRGSMLCDD